MACPSCGSPLVQTKTPSGFVYACRACNGRGATLPVLRKAGATDEFLATLWRDVFEHRPAGPRACPFCRRRMNGVTLPAGESELTLDVCRPCRAVWFDPSEFESLPLKPPPPPPFEKTLPPEAREKLAILELREQQRRAQEKEGWSEGCEGPDETWQWLPGILGLPVELDAPTVTGRPWVTWTLAAACVLVTALTLSGGTQPANEVYRQWGFIPAEWGRAAGLTLVSSFFLHGGLFHLLGNTYFLLIFGDNVEDRLGHGLYAVLILFGHLLGNLVQGLLMPDPRMPCIGASAGISAVIACYAIAYPDVHLGIMFRYFYFAFFRWLRLTAWQALMLYLVLQIGGAFLQVNGFGHVGYLAHLGGLVMGVAAGLYSRTLLARTTAPVPEPQSVP